MNNLIGSVRISLPIILVCALTLLLLAMVGYWEASRQNTVFQISKLSTQAEIVKNSVESYLDAGLPLAQYGRFKQLSNTLLTSDEGIEHLTIVNQGGRQVFFNGRSQQLQDAGKTEASSPGQTLNKTTASATTPDSQYKPSDIEILNLNYKVEDSNSSYRISLPVDSKFGRQGTLIIEASKASVTALVQDKYKTVFIAYGILLAVFSVFVILYEYAAKTSLKNSPTSPLLLKTAYASLFIIMSLVILSVIYQIYEQGAQAKARALTDSMVTRLNSVLELQIHIEDITGITEAFNDYKFSNPEIREIALIESNTIKYHTDADMVGHQHIQPEDAYEYRVDLIADKSMQNRLSVSVALPEDIVHKAIRSSANEFFTLVIACGLISLIFIDATAGFASTLNTGKRTPNPASTDTVAERSVAEQPIADNRLSTTKQSESGALNMRLSLIKPAYFLIVFIHALSISFLPEMVNSLASDSSLSFANLSLPFTLYYLMFAIVLIPAGQYAEKGSLRNIMLAGGVLELTGLIIIVNQENYPMMLLARSFAGAGQGLFLIGLQSYLLAITPKELRTQSAAIKVIGRNAGLISGTAIGALIFSFTSHTTVFIIGSALSVIGMVYLFLITASIEGSNEDTNNGEIQPTTGNATTAQSFYGILRNIGVVFRDTEFVKSLLLIAMPGKMAITGVIMFATPLLLSGHGFAAGEIGQALMLYYIASIVVTHYAARWVDDRNNTRSILFASTIVGGASIFILGFSDVTHRPAAFSTPGSETLTTLAITFNQLLGSFDNPSLPTLVILFCLVMAGISNGLLTSPVVTHINKTRVANEYGVKSVTATYTFLERAGHMLGPLSIGYALSLAFQSNIALSFFGLFTIIFGLLFIVTAKKI
ncbi:MAG: MFS transporter [Pseudomonadales bacterium]|nr:MFS transporter [Pseudomonadales bacterium]